MSLIHKMEGEDKTAISPSLESLLGLIRIRFLPQN